MLEMELWLEALQKTQLNLVELVRILLHLVQDRRHHSGCAPQKQGLVLNAHVQGDAILVGLDCLDEHCLD